VDDVGEWTVAVREGAGDGGGAGGEAAWGGGSEGGVHGGINGIPCCGGRVGPGGARGVMRGRGRTHGERTERKK
jgi:hypothetical protein